MSDLLKRLFGNDFASPYNRRSTKGVLNYQPVEKVMLVYKWLEDSTNHLQPSSKDYAESAQDLFGQLSIPSVIVSGSLKALPEEKHFWNIVTIDGYSFHFDAYFANPKYLEELNLTKLEPFIVDNLAYNFFCVSTQRITQTHTIDEDSPSVDSPHSLSQELVSRLASMKVRVNLPTWLMGLIAYSSLPIIDYAASRAPITLSFE